MSKHELKSAFKPKAAVGALNAITLQVTNGSGRVVAAGGQWSVKDESVNPPVVVGALYPQINPGETAQQIVNLPHAISWGMFHFVAVDGSGEWTDVHGAIPNSVVHLTLH